VESGAGDGDGNAVVAKPSEETPSSATLLAEVMHDAGVPPGAFNLVHGFGAGRRESSSPRIRYRCDHLHGESKTGSAIMRGPRIP